MRVFAALGLSLLASLALAADRVAAPGGRRGVFHFAA